MPRVAFDAALHQQASDVVDSNRGGAEHRGAETLAEIARLGNDADDDKFGRGVTSQLQERERLPNSRIVRRQTKLGAARHKLVFAVDAQGSRFLLRMNGICDYDQVRGVQMGRQIEPRRAEVENFNVRAAFILATKHFHGQWAKAVIAKQNVPYADNARSRGAAAGAGIHRTFT